MKKRDHVVNIIAMACFTGMIAAMIVYQEQARRRGIANTEAICAMFSALSPAPCLLVEPPAGVLDPKKRAD